MNDKFPEFANFIGAYFNQDWDLDGDTDEAIVEFFKGQEPAEIVCKVIVEMEFVIDKFDVLQIDELIENSGCYYYYPASGYNGKTWLIRLKNLLKR